MEGEEGEGRGGKLMTPIYEFDMRMYMGVAALYSAANRVPMFFAKYLQ